MSSESSDYIHTIPPIHPTEVIRKLNLPDNLSIIYYLKLYDINSDQLVAHKIGKSNQIEYRMKYYNKRWNTVVIRLFVVDNADAYEKIVLTSMKQTEHMELIDEDKLEYFKPKYDTDDIIASVELALDAYGITYCEIDPRKLVTEEDINRINSLMIYSYDNVIKMYEEYVDICKSNTQFDHKVQPINSVNSITLTNGLMIRNINDYIVKKYNQAVKSGINTYSELMEYTVMQINDILGYDIIHPNGVAKKSIKKNAETKKMLEIKQYILKNNGKPITVKGLGKDSAEYKYLFQLQRDLNRFMIQCDDKYDNFIEFFKENNFIQLLKSFTIDGSFRPKDEINYHTNYQIFMKLFENNNDFKLRSAYNVEYCYYSFETECIVTEDDYEQDTTNCIKFDIGILYNWIKEMYTNFDIKTNESYKNKYRKLMYDYTNKHYGNKSWMINYNESVNASKSSNDSQISSDEISESIHKEDYNVKIHQNLKNNAISIEDHVVNINERDDILKSNKLLKKYDKLSAKYTKVCNENEQLHVMCKEFGALINNINKYSVKCHVERSSIINNINTLLIQKYESQIIENNNELNDELDNQSEHNQTMITEIINTITLSDDEIKHLVYSRSNTYIIDTCTNEFDNPRNIQLMFDIPDDYIIDTSCPIEIQKNSTKSSTGISVNMKTTEITNIIEAHKQFYLHEKCKPSRNNGFVIYKNKEYHLARQIDRMNVLVSSYDINRNDVRCSYTILYLLNRFVYNDTKPKIIHEDLVRGLIDGIKYCCSHMINFNDVGMYTNNSSPHPTSIFDMINKISHQSNDKSYVEYLRSHKQDVYDVLNEFELIIRTNKLDYDGNKHCTDYSKFSNSINNQK